jgi:methionine-rich copper-binding protein CopC
MRFTVFLCACLFAAIGPMAPVAAAEKTNVAKLLVASSPAKDASGKDPVPAISLEFAEQVELYSVTLYRPSGSELEVFQTSYEPGAPKKMGKAFSFPLNEAISEPGRYKIYYLIATASNKSINGFIDFDIEPKFPEPKLVSITPGDGEELSSDILDLSLELDSDVDLISFDLQQVNSEGDEVTVTTLQSFIDDKTPETSIRKGKSFTFSLAKPINAKGDYAMVYAYTVTNPDGSISPFTGLANFTVK